MITFEEILIENQSESFNPEPTVTITKWQVDEWREMISHVIWSHQQEMRCVKSGVLVTYSLAYFILEDS